MMQWSCYQAKSNFIVQLFASLLGPEEKLVKTRKPKHVFNVFSFFEKKKNYRHTVGRAKGLTFGLTYSASKRLCANSSLARKGTCLEMAYTGFWKGASLEMILSHSVKNKNWCK